jgi:putative endonuclease
VWYAGCAGFVTIGAPHAQWPALASVAVPNARQHLGHHAETMAAARLSRSGMRIVARNQRTTEVRGEIDLIALDRGALVFVEVKALRTGAVAGPERPVLAVGHRKQRKLRSLAIAWLRDHDGFVPTHDTLRFDVVGVRIDARGEAVEWEHLRAAF